MLVRLVVGLLILSTCNTSIAFPSVSGQPPDDQVLTSPSDTTPDTAPPPEEQPPQLQQPKPDDAIVALSELRGAVRTSPESGLDHLALAQALYRIGDLDLALDECRMAVTLLPGDATAQLQLGVTYMAKQHWKPAAAALSEALRLDPTLTQAHYSLGSVQYSLGNLKAAIHSYRRSLELQPDFPDARYRLALVLKLSNQTKEAAQLMEEAAVGGIPQARYFTGNAYRNGQGVDKNLARAIGWWSQAVDLGYQRAAEPLSQLRRQALSPEQSDRRRKDALDAFKQYRDTLWSAYPEIAKKEADESLGAALLRGSEAAHGITVLLAEALALSEPAHDELARLYEQGLNTRLAPHDQRVLTCLETTAADGFAPAKKALARIYGKGIGVSPDPAKAKTLLKGLPKQDIKAALDEMANH